MEPGATAQPRGLDDLGRRTWLRATAGGLAALATGVGRASADEPVKAAGKGRVTQFQIACMTLPYSRFPLGRALTGIKSAGYRHVAWGTTHREGAREDAVLAADAPPDRARELGARCRDLGLEPLMMFSGVYPEADDAPQILRARIKQASAGGVPQVLTFGHTKGGNRSLWVERLKALGPIARDHGVTVVVKQHGGETGTGAACASIIREVGDEGIKVNYDAGNVMDYLDVDPIPDIEACAGEVRSFCIKDHRNVPLDQDCGPGLGVIDHYRLLRPLAFTGRPLPLCCENISAPLLPPPTDPREIDDLARRAREFLEIVTRGLHA
ncbi:TIM barrel protein [Isosphaeraceae bacterium EP7]